MNNSRIHYPRPLTGRTGRTKLDQLLVREKAHIREGDAIAAARRSLPMVEVDAAGPWSEPGARCRLIDVFEGRPQLLVYFHMWHDGKPAEDQCEGCTFFTGHARELSYLHSRDVTYATFCEGPYDESARYRDFMGWEMPWYSARDSGDDLMAGAGIRLATHCYLRDGDRVFETYWTHRSRHGGRCHQLPPARPHRVRQAGDLGEVAAGLAAADRPGPRRSVPDRRTPDRAVVAACGGPFRRPHRLAGVPPVQHSGRRESEPFRRLTHRHVDLEPHATRVPVCPEATCRPAVGRTG